MSAGDAPSAEVRRDPDMDTLTSYVTTALRARAATANPGAEVSSAIPWHVWMGQSLADGEAGYVSLLDPDTFGPAVADLLDALAADDTAAVQQIAADLVGGLAAALHIQAGGVGATRGGRADGNE